MPLSRALMAKVAKTVFNAMGDVVEPVAAVDPSGYSLVVETSVHDPLTASNSKSTVIHPLAKVALVRFTREEIGAPLQGERGALLSNRTPIEASDLKAIFQQSELPTGVAPKHKDFVNADGTQWVILGVRKDPASATWTLQLRAR